MYDECRNCMYQYLFKCFWALYLQSLCIYQYVFKCFLLTLYLEPLSMKGLKEMLIIYIGEVPYGDATTSNHTIYWYYLMTLYSIDMFAEYFYMRGVELSTRRHRD